jgi:hypothetical protein
MKMSMRYLNKQELTLLSALLKGELGRVRKEPLGGTFHGDTLGNVAANYLEDSASDVATVSHFFQFLEQEKILNFKCVRILRGGYEFSDIFLIRFFKTLEKDERQALAMLESFDLGELRPIIEYNKNNLGEFLELLNPFVAKIRRIYFEESEVPFRTQILRSIDFRIETNKDRLNTFFDWYIKKFMEDELTNPKEVEESYDDDGKKHHIYNTKFYPYHAHKLIFLDTIHRAVKKSGYTNQSLWGGLIEGESFKKFEMMHSAQKEGWIKILREEGSFDSFIFTVIKEPFEHALKEFKQEIVSTLSEIEGESDSSIFFDLPQEKIGKSHFFEKTKVLKIEGREVQMNKTGRDTDQTRLLETLFSEPKKTWYADEIYESWSENPLSYKDKNTLDSARRRVNEKVIKSLGARSEFLTGNNQWVKINPIFL